MFLECAKELDSYRTLSIQHEHQEATGSQGTGVVLSGSHSQDENRYGHMTSSNMEMFRETFASATEVAQNNNEVDDISMFLCASTRYLNALAHKDSSAIDEMMTRDIDCLDLDEETIRTQKIINRIFGGQSTITLEPTGGMEEAKSNGNQQ